MEVHHHPHAEKKNLKEYLLEGLMIFVAVTLGFFAESLREHFSGREIEQTNIESLVANLAEDTALLSGTIQFNEMKSARIDSFVALKHAGLPDTLFKKLFFYYAFKLSASQNFIANQTSFEQMKSSGTFRLIRSPATVDSILKYQSLYETIKLQWVYVSKWDDKNQELFATSTDFTALLPIVNRLSLNMNAGDLNANEIPAITTDPVQLQKFFNYEVEEKSSLANYIYFLSKQLSYARALIPFLKKQYNIKNAE